MGMLESATASLAATLRTATAVDVFYTREMTTIGPLRATRGSTPYEATDTDGIIHRTIQRDYLIAAADFPFTDLPRDGDRIADGDETYIVQSMTGSTPYRFADPGKSLLRIHTKKNP